MSQNNSLRAGVNPVWLKRGGAAIVLAGFTWLIVSAVSNTSDEELNPQVVKAPIMIKERPASPGGMQINHQDKQLFDLLESKESSVEVKNDVVEQSKTAEQRNKELVQMAVNKKTAEEVKKEQALAEIAKAKEAASTKMAEAKQVAVKQVAKVQAAPVVKAETKKVEAKPAAPVATTAAAEYKGWALQLGSFRAQADAERAVKTYQAKVGNILQGFNSYVKKVDLGTKGIFYRVYFVGFKDGEQAKETCQQLKVKKQGCFRTKL